VVDLARSTCSGESKTGGSSEKFASYFAALLQRSTGISLQDFQSSVKIRRNRSQNRLSLPFEEIVGTSGLEWVLDRAGYVHLGAAQCGDETSFSHLKHLQKRKSELGDFGRNERRSSLVKQFYTFRRNEPEVVQVGKVGKLESMYAYGSI